ncbi:OstA-like protein [Prevotellaceae bacterium MN60]|nr:OstA-like protein [Prevotellaceae bacterium MN60]
MTIVGLWAVTPAKRKITPRKKVEDKRVYLVHSDHLRYDQYRNGDAQILHGNVHFRHMGADLYCDSAHFYEQTNSFEAFGHVKMKQGDTLSLTSRYAFYDGNDQLAQARYDVVLKHRKTTLYTDSLDYDRMYSFGNFFEGGKLVDGNSVLTSDWGEYHTDTKQAMFYYDVRLKDKKLFLTTDSLFYDTRTSRAHIVGPSNITSGTSHIYSENGYYNTKTEQSELFGRSVIKDQGRTLIGDSVYHNASDGTNYAFRNVIYTDSVNKNMMTGDYCEYNDATGYAMATKRAVTIDFSQKDSLYMHADTFKVYTYNIRTDSVYRKIYAYNKVRAYRKDVQAVCDSLVYNSQDSCMTMYKDPIVWNLGQQLFGEEIRVYMKDSTVDRAHVLGQAFSAEQMSDSIHYNQVSSKEMKAFFLKGEISETQAIDNVLVVYYPIDDADSTIIGLNYTETPLMKMYLENRKMKKIWMEKPTGVLYPMTQVPPAKHFLPQFAWFDYVRPLDKDDIFNWRPKKRGTELKEIKRREPPRKTSKQ